MTHPPPPSSPANHQNTAPHSQISNYARPGFQSRHNRAYWENVPFLAFGNGAASYVDGHRFSRPRGLPEYGQWVDKLAEEGWAKATGAVVAGGAAAAGVGEALLGDGGTGGEEYDEEEEEEGRIPSDEARERVSFVFERFWHGTGCLFSVTVGVRR